MPRTAEVPHKPLTEQQREIFVKFFPLVGKIVNSMRGKLPPYADFDELRSAGVAGLANAIQKLDLSRRDTFDGYIAMRIRGAIIDQLRSLDYMSRSARNDAKNIEKIRIGLEQRLERPPRAEELRQEMGVSARQYDKIMRRTRAVSFIPLNAEAECPDGKTPALSETIADEKSPTPAQNLENAETLVQVRKSLESLPEKQRKVIDDYYFKEKKLGEIAEEFGLTEARICQIHAQALRNLRPKFSN